MTVLARVWKTNLPSNTAFRGFGGPQGMAAMEAIIDRIARYLKKDVLEIRYTNFYGSEKNNITHYGQKIENNRLFVIYDQIMKSSEYYKRRSEVNDFNATHEFIKKGLACTPVKFGISFTTTFLNQAGALVNVYTDGTILVNHGGTEMGQGLHTKIQQIVAAEFGVRLERVKVSATNTSKIPNTSATAASSGTDLNGAAVKNAIDILKSRIAEEMAKAFSEKNPGNPTIQNSIIFQDDIIFDSIHPDRQMKFEEVMNLMRLRQISLSSTGYYRTPKIGWDKQNGWGTPFYYFSFGICVSEIVLDILTGRHTLVRVDILHDAGKSLNPLIDRGQIEGGFIQGVGWCTTEEIKWDDKGRLMTHSPDTYKIPTVQDIPKDFRVELLQGYPNPVAIRQSKTVAEPPFMYGLSTWLAIKDAVSATRNHEIEPEFSLPATNEVILLSIEKLKRK
jgi:xanthine dehydrogenase molybdopterin-binding subunit B